MADQNLRQIGVGIALAAAVGGAVYAVTRKPGGPILPGPSPEQAGPFTIEVVSIVSPLQVGQRGQAVVRVKNTGTLAGTVTVTGETRRDSIREGTWVTQSTTLQPGQSQDLTLQTAGPIDQMFAGQTLQAVFRTSDGRETPPVSFQVQALPASFSIQVVSITSPVQVGQRAQAVVRVQNTGGSPGAVTVTGTTLLNGVPQGTWV